MIRPIEKKKDVVVALLNSLRVSLMRSLFKDSDVIFLAKMMETSDVQKSEN